MESAKEHKKFPRESGHCKCHVVSEFDNTFDFEQFEQLYLEDDLENFDIEAAKLLDILIKNNVDLVRGDLICRDLVTYRNDDLYIFDGEKIIGLYMEVDDYGSLPKDFIVITNNVPPKYWDFIYEGNNLVNRGIAHNSFIWLDVDNDIREQLIDNIKNDGLERFSCYNPDYTINYTSFIFNGNKYYIISCDGEEYHERNYNRFKQILESKSKLLLSYADMYDIFNGNDDNGNLLFLPFCHNEDM